MVASLVLMVVPGVNLVDLVFMFREDRRSLHDLDCRDPGGGPTEAAFRAASRRRAPHGPCRAAEPRDAVSGEACRG